MDLHPVSINFSSTTFQVFILISNLFQKKISIPCVNNISHRLWPKFIHFLSYHFTLRQFIHLKSLSLSHIRFNNTYYNILQDLPHLQRLTSFKIDTLHYQYDRENISYMLHIIWNLPKLIHCYLTNISINFSDGELTFPDAISSSMKYLSIDEMQFTLNQVFTLLKQTPNLRYLHINIKTLHDMNQSLTPFCSSLTVFKVHFSSPMLDQITNLLQHVPNLHHLTFESDGILIDGHQWETLITTYLSKLRRFQFLSQMKFYTQWNKEKKIDRLLDTYRTSFWLDQHQWFVRCDWTRQEDADFTTRYLILYTLPYFQNSFQYSEISYSKSTCPNDLDFWSYIRFPNVQQCSSLHSIRSLFPRILTTLDQLVSLSIWNNDDYNDLFDHAPRLSVLNFRTFYRSQLSLQNTSIRCLYFSISERFNAEQCAELCHSPLFQQCQLLRIGLHRREIVLDLRQKMLNLRGRNDELLKWLHEYLPASCWITRSQSNLIRIWIC